MVKKVLLILSVFCLISKQLWANPVTVEQATQKAKSFMVAKKGSVELNQVTAHGTAASRNYTDAINPLLYVFNIGEEEGFIIISGEDSTPEVLGYAEQGSYDYDRLPVNARAWIDNYAKQIEALRQSGVQAANESVEEHEAIEPLLTCHWNQDAPYYNSCPKFVDNTQTVTGCVATAMAQVLYHHRAKSVPTLQAAIPAYQCSTNWDGHGRIGVSSFAAGSIIDWDNMLDKYDGSATEAQKKAVADLMAYCGASVEMDYRNSWNGGSGANEIGIPEAFKKYFGYSETATVKYRNHFTADNWDRLIYRELMNGRPVIFGGQDENGGGGHAFVCDGYGEDGKYHFNWGWGGLADGYYYINNLQPANQGIGGNGSAYNDNVDVVIGMEPGDGTPYEEKIRVTVTDFSEPATQTYKYSDGWVFSYNYSFQNRTTSTHAFDIALGLYQDGQLKHVFMERGSWETNKTMTRTLSGKMSGTGSWWVSQYGLGTYQMKVVSRLTGEEEWLESADADKWYVDMIIEENQISYILHQYEEPEIVLGGSDPEPEPEPTGIEINEMNFPDEAFRNWLLEQEYGKDQVLTEEEIKEITKIEVIEKGIKSLQGIEYFTALTYLDCDGNQLTALDVTQNTALTELYCGDNQLTELNVTQNVLLTHLQCRDNQLKTLDVTQNMNLIQIYCFNNQLATLDVSKNTTLVSLCCDGNQLTELDVSANTALSYFDCSHNQIAGEAMDALIASLPQTSEGKLYVYNKNSADEGNICTKTQVEKAKAKGWTVYDNDGEEYEGSDDESEDSTTVVVDGIYYNLNADGTATVTSGDEKYSGDVVIPETIEYKDVRYAVTTIGQSAFASCQELTSVTIPNSIDSIGVFAFYECGSLNTVISWIEEPCKMASDAYVFAGNSGNATLYVPKGTKEAYENNGWTGDGLNSYFSAVIEFMVVDEETFPDESFRDVLSKLIDGNVLTEEEIKEITSLDISEAGISDLTGIEYLTALTELICEGNKLESLDVSKNTALTMIDCSRNQISSEAMDVFISSLPEKTAAARATANDAAEVYVLRVYDSTADDEGNVCTKAQVEAIKAKGWTPYYYDGSEWLEYTGYDDEATGINWLGTGDGNVSIYNMAGQKVNLPANAKKGVYIVNGKKVVVK